MNKGQLSGLFASFAARECRGSSELYEHLALHIAGDDWLLELASHARQGQPVPNLLLGAVHYLLISGYEHELAAFYGSVADDPRKAEGRAFSCFQSFCQRYRGEIIALLKDKRVQTNEVRRCAYLYPSFCYIYKLTKKPLALVEIGTSAGLQLLWDQYSYSYGTDKLYGNKESKVAIRSTIKGDAEPFLLPDSPPVAARIGIDLHKNDLSDTEDRLWLQALIWPEHKERLVLFEQASASFNKRDVRLVEGDGVAMLAEITAQIPENTTLCVFHTHVANQMSNETKAELLEKVRRLGRSRNIFHLYNHISDADLHLDYYLNGEARQLTLAETDGHARWFHWRQPPDPS